MKNYFWLQFKMLNRKLIEFGLPLLIGYTVIPVVFILLSNYLFKNTEFAIYVYGLLAISFTSKCSAPARNDFLKSIFNKSNYHKLRILENVLYCLPFTLFLVYQSQFAFAALLQIFIVSIALLNFGVNINIPFPTPFSKKPFEFTVGFRNTFYIFPIAYYLTYISVSVGNFNLGVFALLLIGITCFTYYSKIENEYFVWNYNVSSKEFLREKLKTCFLNFSLLVLPIVITLSIFFLKEIDVLLVFVFVCYAYLALIICAKYLSFPNEINMSKGILIVISFMFPPVLLFFIPHFYSKSVKKLNTVLK